MFMQQVVYTPSGCVELHYSRPPDVSSGEQASCRNEVPRRPRRNRREATATTRGLRPLSPGTLAADQGEPPETVMPTAKELKKHTADRRG